MTNAKSDECTCLKSNKVKTSYVHNKFQNRLHSLFQTITKRKPDIKNQGTFILTYFLLNYSTIFHLMSMVTGSTHASHCVTQPIYYKP